MLNASTGSPEKQTLSWQFKQRIGPLVLLDHTDVDCTNAHRLLGQDVRAQIHKFLSKRLDELGGIEPTEQQIRRARKIHAALFSKTQIPGLDEIIKNAVSEYIACLSAWALGAELADFRHTSLPENVDGLPVTSEDLAIILQEDEVGCQTGVYREAGGSVILWHAEEDVETAPGQRFDRLRLFTFRAADNSIATGFIYPDLLPGPTYAWQSSESGYFAQAVDTLHIKMVDFEDGILPNTLAWLSLYLGTRVPLVKLAKALGPFLGGYSLTGVYEKNNRVGVEKVEFANNQVHCTSLGEASGSTLFQTNIISDLSLPISAEEQASPESRAWNKKRLARTARFIRVVQKCPDALPQIFRMIRSRLGKDSAYANYDVKTYLVCQMKPDKISIWAGAGAAMKSDALYFFTP